MYDIIELFIVFISTLLYLIAIPYHFMHKYSTTLFQFRLNLFICPQLSTPEMKDSAKM